MNIEAVLSYVGTLLWSGWTSLRDYLAAHVLLCLVMAFIIAGYMSTMIPKEVITRYLGSKAPRVISYPVAAIGGFILAVCSCTILPLFAGIWKRGAGLGAAITFLFVGPAVNILAIAYSGAAIGMDIAIARIVLSIMFGILIGMSLAWLFRKEEAKRAAEMADHGLFDQHASMKPAIWSVFLLLIGVLIMGTLQVDVLTRTWISINLPVELPAELLSSLENIYLTSQGALLILLLVIIATAAYLGVENVLEKFNLWKYITLGLAGLIILLAVPSVNTDSLRAVSWGSGSNGGYQRSSSAQLYTRRTGGLAVRDVEIYQADLPNLDLWCFPGGCGKSNYP